MPGAAGTELTVAEPAGTAPPVLAVPADDDEAACEGTAIMAMCAVPAPGAEGGHDLVTDVTSAACPAGTVARLAAGLVDMANTADRGQREQHPAEEREATYHDSPSRPGRSAEPRHRLGLPCLLARCEWRSGLPAPVVPVAPVRPAEPVMLGAPGTAEAVGHGPDPSAGPAG